VTRFRPYDEGLDSTVPYYHYCACARDRKFDSLVITVPKGRLFLLTFLKKYSLIKGFIALGRFALISQ